MTPLRFTILGGGYIGSYFSKLLNQNGIANWVPQRDDPAIFDSDLGCVVYCIGMTQDYLQNPVRTMDAHVNKLSAVLQSSNFRNLVYLSSTRLFDGLEGSVSEESQLHLHPGNPRHLFDLSKAAGEALCCAVQKLDLAVARLSTVYDDQLFGQCFVHELLKKAFEPGTDPINIESSPDLARDYIHIDDVCEALLQISARHSHRIYNVASGARVLNKDLFEMIERRTGRSLRAVGAGATVSVPEIDITRMRSEFNWHPRAIYDWLSALKR